MKAVIMAGGEGTRLRPLTCNRPKPMVPVVNTPVMEHIIKLLKKHGFKDIAVTLQYMPDSIKDYFDDGSEFGVNLKYFVEDSPLGTAGSVKNAEDFLTETFVVISGDALTDLDISKAVAFHKEKHSMATLVLKKVDIPIEYGVVVTDKEGRITRFLEKPSWGEVFSDTVNTGIYILSPEIFSFFNKNEVFDFSKDLFPILLKNNLPMFGYVTQDYWCDIGDVNAYMQVHYDILDKKVKVEIPGVEIREGIWIGEGVYLERDALIKAPAFIGKNSVVHSDSVIDAYSIIGENCTVESRSSIKKSIIWRGCKIAEKVQLRGCILCDKIKFSKASSAFEGAIIGEKCTIGEHSAVRPGIKVWPNKIIDSDTEINANLIWGTRYSRSLFGHKGITGENNIAITPEFISRLGAAFGSICSRNARIAVSTDEHQVSNSLKQSLIAGLLSAGIEVYDTGSTLLPVIRSAIVYFKLNGGIHISFSRERDNITIDFLNSSGNNINRKDERKVENTFIREEFTRCEANDIKPVINISQHKIYYIQSVINTIKSKKIEGKILILAKSPLLRETIESTLNKLNCDYNFVNNIDYRHSGSFSAVKRIGTLVKSQGYDFGAIFDDNGEKVLLIDRSGRIISDDLYLAIISLIHLQNYRGSSVVVPLQTSGAVEKIAEKYGGRVLRTKTSTKELMNSILKEDSQQEMMEFFLMNFDALYAVVRILDYMQSNDIRLDEMVDSIPRFYMNKAVIKCSWGAKGKVISTLIDENDDSNIETTDGLKIICKDGWTLILPDDEKPICRIISEGVSQEFAQELTDFYIKRIKRINKE